MKKFFREFKEFISRGSVVDMAVAVIIGNAFKAIVTALVDNVIMPLISVACGGMNFTEWKHVLVPETVKLVDGAFVVEPEVAITYGVLIQAVIDFLIVALCIFLALKTILAFQTKAKELLAKKNAEEEVAEEAPAETEMDVLKDIRELLKKENA